MLRPGPELAAELGAAREVLDRLLGREPAGGDGGDAPLEPAADLQQVPDARVGQLGDQVEGLTVALEGLGDGPATPGLVRTRQDGLVGVQGPLGQSQVVADHVPVDRTARPVQPGEDLRDAAVELGTLLLEQQPVGGLGDQAVPEPVGRPGCAGVHHQVGGQQGVEPVMEVLGPDAQDRGEDRLVELLAGDGEHADDVTVDAGRGQPCLQLPGQRDRERGLVDRLLRRPGQLLQVEGHALALPEHLLPLAEVERGAPRRPRRSWPRRPRPRAAPARCARRDLRPGAAPGCAGERAVKTSSSRGGRVGDQLPEHRQAGGVGVGNVVDQQDGRRPPRPGGRPTPPAARRTPRPAWAGPGPAAGRRPSRRGRAPRPAGPPPPGPCPPGR